MSDMSFTWRGVSSDEHGVVVRSLPPIYAPQVRDEAIPIAGRHGALHLQDGAYDEQLMMIEGYLPYEQGGEVSDIETIKAWLQGYGDLTLSDRPERRYKARIVDAITFTAWVAGFRDRLFSVSFWADPLAYEAVPQTLTFRRDGPLNNPGTAPADPTIVVYGAGRVTLTVGARSVTLDGLAGPVTIDCGAKTARLGVGGEGAHTAITLDDQDWPVLGLGETWVSWTGGATEVRITPNWRWI